VLGQPRPRRLSELPSASCRPTACRPPRSSSEAPTPALTEAADSFDERIDLLERLAKLQRIWRLTDEEFAEQKRKLLDL